MDSDVESDDEASTAELREGLVVVKLSRELKLSSTSESLG